MDGVGVKEALQQRYDEGDTVDTPDGIGVVSEIRTESFTGPEDDEIEASDDSPAYVVALGSEDKTVGVYNASDLSADELPEVDVEDPTDELEAMANITDAVEDYEALNWNAPESWEESETPVRVIALDAWSSMGGQFDCGGACCKGEMAPRLGDRGSDEFCASFKDYILGTEQWRGWGPD
jgi:hypothetical protein